MSCTYHIGVKLCLSICYVHIWNVPRDNDPSGFMFTTLNSNCCSLRPVNFLFSTLRSTPFHYVKMYFGALQNHNADVRRSDTPSGSKLLHL